MTSESGPGNVTSAFQVLQEEVEKEIDGANRAVTDCLARGDHGDAEKSLQRSKALTAFRDKVAELAKGWAELSLSAEQSENERIRDLPSNGKSKGQPTPRKEFVKPILQVLDKMGGSGEANAVVERVGRIMKPVLGEVDYERLSGGMQRWQKNVHWARWKMVKEGFLNPYSRRGIWELTEKGREELHDLP